MSFTITLLETKSAVFLCDIKIREIKNLVTYQIHFCISVTNTVTNSKNKDNKKEQTTINQSIALLF
jgi:hypothetical protein